MAELEESCQNDEEWEHSNISERKHWREAIRKKFNDMIKRQVWRETDIDQIPSNRRLIGSKWVFKKKITKRVTSN